MLKSGPDKRITLTEAAQLVRPGDTLALGGMTLYRRPVAFVRELIRQGPGDLTLLAFTAGYESDLLVGAGLVKRVRTCYFGLEIFGLAPMFSQRAERGDIEVVEETEASLAFGLRATLAGVGFMPGQGWLGTDLLRVRPDVKLVTDPYSGSQYVAFPAVKPDVVVIHAPVATRTGDVVLRGNLAVDYQLAMAADRVIITAERVVEKPDEPLDIIGVAVDAVVEAPRGAAPTSCWPDYPLNGIEILRYVEACTGGGFDAYLKAFLGR